MPERPAVIMPPTSGYVVPRRSRVCRRGAREGSLASLIAT
jgi:hypothetical protein